MRFILAITTDDFDNMSIETVNDDLPDATVILYAETWLEYFKKKAKQPIRDSLA